MFTLLQTTAPVNEPFTTAQAKLHLKQDDSADDTLVDWLIAAARDKCEADTGRQLITADWTLTLPSFPTEILFPRPKLQGVITPTYTDTAGSSQSLSSSVYQLDLQSEPGRMRLGVGQSWPATGDYYNAVSIVYRCGYGLTSASIPDALLQAMYLLMGHWYEHREAVVIGPTPKVVPVAYEALITPFKVAWLWEEAGLEEAT